MKKVTLNIVIGIAILCAVLLTNSSLIAEVKSYFITCDPDDFKYIYDHHEQDHYIPITFTYAGKTWTDVKMRIRGDDSRLYPKKSLKINFGIEKFIDGQDKLN